MAKKTPPKPKPAYDMLPPNDEAADWITLLQLRQAGPANEPTGQLCCFGEYEREWWLAAITFEQLCEKAPDLKKALDAAAAAGYSDRKHEQVGKALERVFLDEYLAKVIGPKFYDALPVMISYFLAKRAYADLPQTPAAE